MNQREHEKQMIKDYEASMIEDYEKSQMADYIEQLQKEIRVKDRIIELSRKAIENEEICVPCCSMPPGACRFCEHSKEWEIFYEKIEKQAEEEIEQEDKQ